MKRIVLDTDVGGDCDDVGALVMLKSFVRENVADIACVTSCTTMEGAEHTIDTVLGYYGLHVPIGVMTDPPFMCDGDYNRYARQVKRKYGGNPAVADAVAVLRCTLATSDGKCTLVGIGPQRNLARFLQSGPDEYSPLGGIALAAQKLEEMVIMGGTFTDRPILFENKTIGVEWNIEQDVAAARFVAEHAPVGVVYCPFELGYDIETGRNLPAGSPARFCYDVRSGLTRASWDPCAVYYGVLGCGELFTCSERGAVRFDENGYSTFTADKEGKHRILLQKAPSAAVATELDRWMR